MESKPLGIFAYRDYDSRWYVGAEWHYATDFNTPARIVNVSDDTDPFAIEALFMTDGYATEAGALSAIGAANIPG